MAPIIPPFPEGEYQFVGDKKGDIDKTDSFGSLQGEKSRIPSIFSYLSDKSDKPLGLISWGYGLSSGCLRWIRITQRRIPPKANAWIGVMGTEKAR